MSIAKAKTLLAILTITLWLVMSIAKPYSISSIEELGVIGAPNAICILNQFLYIFGFENSSGYPKAYAMVIDTARGAIAKVFVGSFGGFYSCATHRGRVYVVGAANTSSTSTSWLITVFDEKLNIVKNALQAFSQGVDVAIDIAILDERLYIVGIINKSGFSLIRIEKRLADNLALESSLNISIGLGKRITPRITVFRDGIALGYTLDDTTHIILLSRDLKLLNKVVLRSRWSLLSLAATDACLYLGTTEGVVEMCEGYAKAFHYAGGGSVVSIKQLNYGIAVLILVPDMSNFATAELRLLDEGLRLLHREELGRGYRYQLYVKPVELVGDRVFIALAKRGWVLKNTTIAPQQSEIGRAMFTAPAEVIVLIVYALATAIATIYAFNVWKGAKCKCF
ncbi:MAG: hypothetical protein LM572_04250 [Ignisphaera sp.]|nr:hypothetical protein [Ignisphaera sp.]